MKIIYKSNNGVRREALLKECFLTDPLIALLKCVGEEARRRFQGELWNRLQLEIDIDN